MTSELLGEQLVKASRGVIGVEEGLGLRESGRPHDSLELDDRDALASCEFRQHAAVGTALAVGGMDQHEIDAASAQGRDELVQQRQAIRVRNAAQRVVVRHVGERVGPVRRSARRDRDRVPRKAQAQRRAIRRRPHLGMGRARRLEHRSERARSSQQHADPKPAVEVALLEQRHQRAEALAQRSQLAVRAPQTQRLAISRPVVGGEEVVDLVIEEHQIGLEREPLPLEPAQALVRRVRADPAVPDLDASPQRRIRVENLFEPVRVGLRRIDLVTERRRLAQREDPEDAGRFFARAFAVAQAERVRAHADRLPLQVLMRAVAPEEIGIGLVEPAHGELVRASEPLRDVRLHAPGEPLEQTEEEDERAGGERESGERIAQTRATARGRDARRRLSRAGDLRLVRVGQGAGSVQRTRSGVHRRATTDAAARLVSR